MAQILEAKVIHLSVSFLCVVDTLQQLRHEGSII